MILRDFADMQEQARRVRSAYAGQETARYGRAWTTDEVMLGFLGG